MTEVFFWLFMLAMALLIPGSMLLLGRSFANNPPGEINGGYGYRTTRSMKNRNLLSDTAGGSGIEPPGLCWRSLWCGRPCCSGGTSARWGGSAWF